MDCLVEKFLFALYKNFQDFKLIKNNELKHKIFDFQYLPNKRKNLLLQPNVLNNKEKFNKSGNH